MSSIASPSYILRSVINVFVSIGRVIVLFFSVS
jgi:hypothetical protein